MNAAEQRSRASALLLLLAVIVAGVAAVLVPAVLKWRALGTDIAQARAQITKSSEADLAMRALVDSGTQWRSFTASSASGLVRGIDSETARKAASEHIATVIRAHGGTVKTSEATTRAESGALSARIWNETTATIARDQLGSLLMTLESEPPYLVLDSIRLTEEPDDRLTLHLRGSMFRFDPMGVEEE